MEAPVEIRYAGVVIGRAQEVRGADDESTFFLPGKEPMPVGTVVHLRSGDRETPARVLRAVESPDPSVAGMHVRLIGEAEVVAPDFIPAPVQAKAVTKGGTPTPAVQVNMGLMEIELARHAPAAPPVPEAVPVAIGSSLTGALERAAADAPATGAATEAAPVEPTADAPAAERATTVESPTLPDEPASPAAEAAPSAEASGGDSAGAASQGAVEEPPPGDAPKSQAGGPPEDMPTARPIAGSSGRRKTKRRRYQ